MINENESGGEPAAPGGGAAGVDSEEDAATEGQAPEELTTALEATLKGLNNTIEKMEELVRRLEAGDPDWEENIKLLGEANEIAVSSSRRLDQVVQDVV